VSKNNINDNIDDYDDEGFSTLDNEPYNNDDNRKF
jgi:hypothetical protein